MQQQQSWWSWLTTPQIKTVELEAAPELKKVEPPFAYASLYANMWSEMCTHRAIFVFVQLHLADVIGNQTLSVEDLSEKAACRNVPVLTTVLRVLHNADIVELDGDTVKLTEKGALLQRGLTPDFCEAIEFMFDINTQNSWYSIAPMISNVEVDKPQLTDAMLSLYCTPLNCNRYEELSQALVKENLIDLSSTVGYWGVDDNTAAIVETNPNATVVNIDALSSVVEPLDYFILHRIMSLYGLKEFVSDCVAKLRKDGTMVVIDTVEHDKTACKDLFAHTAHLPRTPSLIEWQEMFEPDLTISHLSSIQPDVIVLRVHPPMRV